MFGTFFKILDLVKEEELMEISVQFNVCFHVSYKVAWELKAEKSAKFD